MIRNQWYAVLESGEVKPGRVLGATRLGEQLVFWRNEKGQIACLRDRCAHRGVALSIGRVIDGHVRCPFHGFEYDALGRGKLIPANGRAAAVPDNFRVEAYPARDGHGFVWIWWGEAEESQELPPLPWFEDLDESFCCGTLRDPWRIHYSRAIENQLDVMHLPFVHHNTIGRGGKTLVHGPGWEIKGDRLTVWMRNVVDDGSKPLKPEELPREGTPALLQFHFPNVWQNRIADRVRVTIAFAPVDEENSLLYIRYYHKLTRVPGVRWLITRAGLLFSRIIAHQDRRVVVTQQPKRSDLKIGENLAQGDGPVVAYRKRRRELIEAAGK